MILKYLIPFDRFVIDSSLSSVEARRRVEASMEPKKLIRFGGGEGGLEGVMTVHGFRINRIVGRNSFNALAVGEIDPAPGGSRIRVHMRMTAFAYLFVTMWLSFAGMACTTIIVDLQSGGSLNPLTISDFMPLVFLFFGPVMFNGGFWWSANRLKSSLRTIFEARTSAGYGPTVR